MDTKQYYQEKYTHKCAGCGFPLTKDDGYEYCDECTNKELEKQDKENEARREYIANGGSEWDF